MNLNAPSVPMTVPSYRTFLSVNMDVSLTAVDAAVAKWYETHTTYPSVLWVSPADLGCAAQAISIAPEKSPVRRLTPIASPEYSADAWSVGSYLDKGFGCEGA